MLCQFFLLYHCFVYLSVGPSFFLSHCLFFIFLLTCRDDATVDARGIRTSRWHFLKLFMRCQHIVNLHVHILGQSEGCNGLICSLSTLCQLLAPAFLPLHYLCLDLSLCLFLYLSCRAKFLANETFYCFLQFL